MSSWIMAPSSSQLAGSHTRIRASRSGNSRRARYWSTFSSHCRCPSVCTRARWSGRGSRTRLPALHFGAPVGVRGQRLRHGAKGEHVLPLDEDAVEARGRGESQVIDEDPGRWRIDLDVDVQPAQRVPPPIVALLSPSTCADSAATTTATRTASVVGRPRPGELRRGAHLGAGGVHARRGRELSRLHRHRRRRHDHRLPLPQPLARSRPCTGGPGIRTVVGDESIDVRASHPGRFNGKDAETHQSRPRRTLRRVNKISQVRLISLKCILESAAKGRPINVAFLSHSWHNKPAARRVVEALAQESIPCCLDDPMTSNLITDGRFVLPLGVRFPIQTSISTLCLT